MPLLLLVAQIPDGSLTLLQKAIEGLVDERPALGFALLFPLLCLASALSAGLSFLLILQRESGQKPSLKEAIRQLKLKFPQILVASLAVGVFFVLGVAALVLPALYFMAIYLFVTQIILSNEKTTLSKTLYYSKKLVSQSKRTLVNTMCLVLMSITICLLTYLAGQKLGEWTASLTTQAEWQGVLSTSIDIFFSMVGGSIVDVWIAHTFLALKRKAAE